MKLPPPMAFSDQHLMADRLYEHMLREGVKAKDDVVLVPVGAWVAKGGPLRPGLDKLGARLRAAGVNAKTAKDQCVLP